MLPFPIARPAGAIRPEPHDTAVSWGWKSSFRIAGLAPAIVPHPAHQRFDPRKLTLPSTAATDSTSRSSTYTAGSRWLGSDPHASPYALSPASPVAAPENNYWIVELVAIASPLPGSTVPSSQGEASA